MSIPQPQQPQRAIRIRPNGVRRTDAPAREPPPNATRTAKPESRMVHFRAPTRPYNLARRPSAPPRSYDTSRPFRTARRPDRLRIRTFGGPLLRQLRAPVSDNRSTAVHNESRCRRAARCAKHTPRNKKRRAELGAPHPRRSTPTARKQINRRDNRVRRQSRAPAALNAANRAHTAGRTTHGHTGRALRHDGRATAPARGRGARSDIDKIRSKHDFEQQFTQQLTVGHPARIDALALGIVLAQKSQHGKYFPIVPVGGILLDFLHEKSRTFM